MNRKNANPSRVVLIRHAQSEWNRQNRFSGWADPPLTQAGRQEAIAAGRALARRGQGFAEAYSSRLTRAMETTRLLLAQIGDSALPIQQDWRLNERHYGALQGLDKAAVARKVGEAQVWRWRRSYLEQPPQLAIDDPRHRAQLLRWTDLPPEQIPNGESLAQTRARVLGFWNEVIAPRLQEGIDILISSHGNTLRALLMALDRMSVAQVESLEIPTGVPILYQFDLDGTPVGWRYLDSPRDAA